MFYVYFLYCPHTGELVYIGQSKNPKARKTTHEKRLDRELMLGDDMIECKTWDEAIDIEVAEIRRLNPTANRSDKRLGLEAHTSVAKSRISAAKEGVKRAPFDDVWKSRMGRKGIPKPEGFGAKMSAILKGRKFTPEHRAALVAAQAKVERKGKPKPEGFGALVASKLKGVPHTEERKANIRLAQQARRERERKLKG